jgi:hypothetical protein
MRLPKLNVAFDIDGIVANFEEPFREWALEKYGLTFVETGHFHWEAEPFITNKMFTEIIAEFISYGEPEIPILDGSLVVDYLWRKCPSPILFVTARHPSTAGDTHEWIKQHFPKIDFFLAVVDSGSDKHRYLESHGAFIEDRRKTALELANRGKVVFMPMRSYNSIVDYRGSGKWTLTKIPNFPIFTPSDWKSYAFEATADFSKGAIILLRKTADMTNGLFDHILFK